MTETISQIAPGKPATNKTILNNKTKRMYRRRGFSNLLKMGHCAPAVMQTLQDLGNKKEDWLVKMTAGLPGGIGNTGFECGGTTAPLIQLGLDYGLRAKNGGLPPLIIAGHNYLQQFRQCNNSLFCKEILGDRRVPLPCIKVVRHAPELYKQIGTDENSGAISGDTREAFNLLYHHLTANSFHCAHAVFGHLGNKIPQSPELLDATSAFIGGTAFKGLTCSALTAGIMVVGLKHGEIENSHLRVMRMLSIMVLGGNAFADHLNKFNKIMNTGHRMSKWFREEFGSTQCHEITNCDFSSIENVQMFIENGSVASCKTLVEKVARHAEEIISK